LTLYLRDLSIQVEKHDGSSREGAMAYRDIRPIKLKVWDTKVATAVTWSYPDSDGKYYLIPTYKMTVDGKDDTGTHVTREFEVIRFGPNRHGTKGKVVMVGLQNFQTHTIKLYYAPYTVHSARSEEKGAWKVFGNFLIHDGPDDPMNEFYATAGCIEICGGPRGFDIFNDLLLSLSGSKKKTRLDKLRELGGSGKMVITYMKAEKPPIVEYTP
jgi:hypothetical protein